MSVDFQSVWTVLSLYRCKRYYLIRVFNKKGTNMFVN